MTIKNVATFVYGTQRHLQRYPNISVVILERIFNVKLIAMVLVFY